MSSEPPSNSSGNTNSEKPAAAAGAHVDSTKHDAAVRTAVVAGWFGIAGTVLTCVITWALNHIDLSARAPVTTNISAPATHGATSPGATSPASNAASVVAVAAKAPAERKLARYEELLRQSPINFADWQATVRDRFTVEQRRNLFGGQVGTRVTWQGVFDQYNLIELAPITRDDAYILLMFENEADRHATPLRPAPALCHFPALAKRQLSELHPGQRIVISGTLANPELTGQLLGTELQACELVAVLDGNE